MSYAAIINKTPFSEFIYYWSRIYILAIQIYQFQDLKTNCRATHKTNIISSASKSWSYLFTTYGYEDNASGNKNARSYPLSYVYSGSYYWGTGRLYLQTVYGYYWSSSIVSSTDSYRLDMSSTRLIKAYSNNKRIGYALRCVIFSAPTAPMLPHGII